MNWERIMIWQKLYEAMRTFMSAKDRIMNDPKTKTDPRKRLKILDEWHMIWGELMRSTDDEFERAIYMGHYNMLTNTIVYGFSTLETLDSYLNHLGAALIKICKTHMSEER